VSLIAATIVSAFSTVSADRCIIGVTGWDKPLELASPLGGRTTDPRTHSPWVADGVTPRELPPELGSNQRPTD